MIKIIKQPRWAFWRYEETYEFETPVTSSDLIERIESFYMQQRVRNLVREPGVIRFSRGSVLGSLLSMNERHHRQEVTISTTGRGPVLAVICRHLCWDPYPNLHMGSRTLEHEVQRLEDFIRGLTHEPPNTSLEATPTAL